MQRLEKMYRVEKRLANINALYHKFVLIFIFKSRKMDGGRGVLRHSTQTVFCCNFCAEETHIIACQWAVDRMESTVFYKHPSSHGRQRKQSTFVTCIIIKFDCIRCRSFVQRTFKAVFCVNLFLLIHVI